MIPDTNPVNAINVKSTLLFWVTTLMILGVTTFIIDRILIWSF